MLIMPCGILLTKSFIEADGAGDRDIQGLNDPHLGDNEISIGESTYFLADTRMFIAEDQGDPPRQLHVIQGYRITAEMRGKNAIDSFTQFAKTVLCIGMLMDG